MPIFMEILGIDPALARWIWIGLGVALIAFEFAIPGLVAVFFGVGAILTGLLVALGVLDSPPAQVLFWVVSSGVAFFTLREQVRRWFPAFERYKPPTGEDDLIGKEVEVIEAITEAEPGRVRFQGSSWKAICRSGPVAAGLRVKITGRDNLVLYVSPSSESN